MALWQPLTWYIFHTISLNYNNEYQKEYIKFFETFKTIIPCKICRTHYTNQLNNENMKLENNINSERIFNWTVDLHNNVNKMNNTRLWSYDEARNYYQKNNFNNKLLKLFLFQYIKNNFKKYPEKTNELIKMMNTILYFHPNINKRNKLIEFNNKFNLSRENLKKWLLVFLIILKN
jgi:hypothetical protein